MNKIDMADADKNITKIMRRYDQVSSFWLVWMIY